MSSEFLLVNFIVLSVFDLLKPNLVSGIIRLDWYFGALLIVGGANLIFNK